MKSTRVPLVRNQCAGDADVALPNGLGANYKTCVPSAAKVTATKLAKSIHYSKTVSGPPPKSNPETPQLKRKLIMTSSPTKAKRGKGVEDRSSAVPSSPPILPPSSPPVALAEPEPDPFDPAALQLTDATSSGVEKVLTNVPCDKPNKHVFSRVHPSEDFRLETALFFDQAERKEAYLVSPALRDSISTELVPVRLMTAITRHGDVFLWPVKLPGPDGRSNHWHESMAAAAEIATKEWVRVSANMNAGRYDVVKATGKLPEPDWPDKTLQELLKLSFENRFIESVGHPVLKSLRGEV